jgi:hypothetical protein
MIYLDRFAVAVDRLNTDSTWVSDPVPIPLAVRAGRQIETWHSTRKQSPRSFFSVSGRGAVRTG